MAGVTGLGEGGGGVDGVSPTTQNIGGVQELGVGHSLQTQVNKIRFKLALKRSLLLLLEVVVVLLCFSDKVVYDVNQRTLAQKFIKVRTNTYNNGLPQWF